MKKPLVEICCGSAEDAILAAEGGADRVELCSNLFQGGLTPTLGSLLTVKRHASIPVMTMLRPREGGFCYTETEFETLLEDAGLFLEHGTDGLVFGVLKEDGRVDEERVRRLVTLADGRPCVFHRAFDLVPDWKEAMETLISLGVTRILTSAQSPNVFLAHAVFREMLEYADGRIEMLPGAGLRPANIEEFVRNTGTSQVHMSLHKIQTDPTGLISDLHFGYPLYPSEAEYRAVDREKLRSMMKQLS